MLASFREHISPYSLNISRMDQRKYPATDTFCSDERIENNNNEDAKLCTLSTAHPSTVHPSAGHFQVNLSINYFSLANKMDSWKGFNFRSRFLGMYRCKVYSDWHRITISATSRYQEAFIGTYYAIITTSSPKGLYHHVVGCFLTRSNGRGIIPTVESSLHRKSEWAGWRPDVPRARAYA